MYWGQTGLHLYEFYIDRFDPNCHKCNTRHVVGTNKNKINISSCVIVILFIIRAVSRIDIQCLI